MNLQVSNLKNVIDEGSKDSSETDSSDIRDSKSDSNNQEKKPSKKDNNESSNI